MILTQSHDGSASDTNHAGVSDANLAVASDTAPPTLVLTKPLSERPAGFLVVGQGFNC